MDIELKRKAFGAWHESKYGEHIIWSNGSPVSHIHNDRWQGWLAATAKAQTVPEGFVLVPEEPIQLFKEKLEDYLVDLWTGDHGCDWDGFLSADAVEHDVLWKMMLEAREQN